MKLPRIGLIGGGQLARMLIYRNAKLGFHFTVLDPDAAAGAAPLADRFLQGSLYDREALTALVTTCDVTTYDIEHCDTEVLAELEAQGHVILPSPRLLQTVQDKVLQKQLYLSKGLPVAPFVNKTWHDLAPEDFPVVQKARRGGYDGRGVAVLRSAADQPLTGDTYLEALVTYEKELGVMVARSASGETVVYPPVEMLFDPHWHICTEIVAPAPVSPAVEARARELAVAVVEALGGVGVFGVELFLTATGLVVNEVAPRPHNSGHYTMEACQVCQFENHLRAVAGLPLGQPGFFTPAAMVNLLGQGSGTTVVAGLKEALAVPGFSLHLYGKTQCRPGRKMGHFTVTAPSPALALATARRINETFQVTGA
ncbi:MAG: 5-(carboxyamino)imidazole ribonucleotide synthase [Spirochaetales bacterium]